MAATSRDYREKLIDEVKKYPVLYDTTHEHHRDIDVRDRCWADIADRLGGNCELLKREWKILRDSLRQSLRKSRAGTTTKAGAPCKRWRFQSRMAFVLPHMTQRKNLRQPREDLKVDEAEQSEVEQEPPGWEPEGGLVEASVGDDGEALDLFFASVCQSTKRLPRHLQHNVKRQVLDVLLRAEEQLDAETDSKIDDFKSC